VAAAIGQSDPTILSGLVLSETAESGLRGGDRSIDELSRGVGLPTTVATLRGWVITSRDGRVSFRVPTVPDSSCRRAVMWGDDPASAALSYRAGASQRRRNTNLIAYQS
jgi:hypothetical protein